MVDPFHNAIRNVSMEIILALADQSCLISNGDHFLLASVNEKISKGFLRLIVSVRIPKTTGSATQFTNTER